MLVPLDDKAAVLADGKMVEVPDDKMAGQAAHGRMGVERGRGKTPTVVINNHGGRLAPSTTTDVPLNAGNDILNEKAAVAELVRVRGYA